MLAARIDQLPAEEKRLLQTAAVLGTEVPLPLQQAIAEVPEAVLQRHLTALQSAEFLYETRLFPEYEDTFKHALTQEVAYGSLLLERRRVLHARIGAAFETLAEERVAEQVKRLAHHVNAQVLCHLSLGEGQLLAGRPEEAHALAEGTLALAGARRERGHQVYALCHLGDIAARRDPPDSTQAEVHYHQALVLAEELGMRPLQAHSHRTLGTLYATIGRRAEACAKLDTAITLYRTMEMTFWLPQAEAALIQLDGCEETRAG